MNRRNFFKKAFGLVGAALCWPVAKVLGEKEPRRTATEIINGISERFPSENFTFTTGNSATIFVYGFYV